MPEIERSLVVIGIGNPLLADEGVGIHAIRGLEKRTLPPSVELVDGGTAGLDLLFWLEGADYAVIIDCVEADAEPGTIVRIPAEELLSDGPGQSVSLHDVTLPQVLSVGQKTGRLPPIVVYGVQPATISVGTELSPGVEKSLPRLLRLIEDELGSCAVRNTCDAVAVAE